MNGRLTVYKDAAGEYRWTLRAANGKVVADSAEGYTHREDCVEMARELWGDVEVETE